MDNIDKIRLHENDNGSPGVQIVRLTERIEALGKHLRKHRTDHSSRRGLIRMVWKRRMLLGFLRRTDPDRYKLILAIIGLDR